MALVKKQQLRKMEFVFTEDKVHPTVHCLYNIIIEEDGVEISRMNHRENGTLADMKTALNAAAEYVEPPLQEPK